MISERVVIYTDGSSKGNPGSGGYGTIIVSGDNPTEFSGGYYLTTNNRMEVLAAIVGLEHLKNPSDVIIVSDSKYLVDTFEKRWIQSWVKNDWKNWKGQSVKNCDLWKRLLDATKLHNVTFEWVKGHNNHLQNERCDKLATTAADHPSMNDVWFEENVLHCRVEL